MRIAAIIAEYNPFHNGHSAHIQLTREQSGADHIVAIMSGSFVQRGEPACVDKFTRAIMAVRGGVDLVIELPVPWAMAGAETFARGGVGIADALGCVDYLSFGSESGSVEQVARAAQLIDDPSCKAVFQAALSSGMSYAAAWAKAISSTDPSVAAVFENPNDTLGLEYCRALIKSKSSITPLAVRRIGVAHDQASPDPHSDRFASASAIRSMLRSGETTEIDATRYMPESSAALLQRRMDDGRALADLSRLERTILFHLRGMSDEDLARLPDVSEGLENRITKVVAQAEGTADFIDLCNQIKSKRYTHARIRRILLSALLGITAEDSAGAPPYIRVLAMGDRGKDILSAAKKSTKLPIITRYSQVARLEPRAQRVFAIESRATDIFGLTLPDIPPAGMDMAQKLIIE